MTSQVCCLIRTLKGQIDTLEGALEECGEAKAALTPPPPVLLAATAGFTNSTTATTPAIDTSGAGFISIVVADAGAPPVSLADSYGNAWTRTGSGSLPVYMYHCHNPKVGPNHTFTVSAGTPSIHVAAFSWAGAFQGFSLVAGPSPLAITPLTPLSPGSLLVSGVSTLGTDIIGINNGFKMVTEVHNTATTVGGALAYKVTDETSAQSPTWSLPAGQGLAYAMAMFDATIPVQSAPVEPTAWDHWRFQLPAGPASAAPIVGANGHNATPVAPVIPTGKSVIMQAGLPGVINGINLGYPDTANFTACLVMKRQQFVPSAYHYLLGSGNLNTGVGGELIIAANASNNLGIYAGTINAITPFLAANINEGDWCFVVLRRSSNLYGGMIGGSVFMENTYAIIATTNNLSIGNIVDTINAAAVLAPQLEVAECIVFASALTNQQVLDVYNRSKLRMAAIGISITGGLPNTPSSLLLASTSKGLAAAGGFTDPVDTTGAELIVLNLAYYDGGTLTDVEDSQGNTYLPLTPHIDPATGAIQQLWYCENPATGTAHQVQINGATIFASIQVAAFGGVSVIPASPLDQEGGGIGSGLSITVGPVGQTTPLSLVIAGLAFSDAQPTPPAHDTELYTIGAEPYIFGQHFGSAMAFKFSDSLIAHSAHWDFTVPMSGTAAGIATFKVDGP